MFMNKSQIQFKELVELFQNPYYIENSIFHPTIDGIPLYIQAKYLSNIINHLPMDYKANNLKMIGEKMTEELNKRVSQIFQM